MLEPVTAAIAALYKKNPAGLSVQELAPRLGKAWQTLYSWSNAGPDGHAPTLEAFAQLKLASKDARPMDEYCRLAGGAFIDLPAAGPLDAALVRTIKETAEAIAATASALHDGALTDRERAQARRETREAIAALMALLAALEGAR